MGIINTSPDSFAGNGVWDQEEAYKLGVQMLEDGADLLDVGGESTRPGALPIGPKEEIRRTAPLIKRLRKITNLPISIDTYKPEVASAALDSGATVINDIYASRHPGMLDLLKETDVPVIIMHMQGTPKTMQNDPSYDDVRGEIIAFFKKRIKKLTSAGINADRIIIDPGIGFGKRVEDNLTLISYLPELVSLGFPVLVGPSRKSFIGKVLALPVEERLAGTLSVLALCVAGGVNYLRVHDVKAACQAVKMAEAVISAPAYP
ncbi:MAG: dihydropteroate synthase [Candidatus Eremiobacteraeota bacterium]|nr:dihydropteroate synthase [Candidatus Eremiobacteraeota bacterium]